MVEIPALTGVEANVLQTAEQMFVEHSKEPFRLN